MEKTAPFNSLLARPLKKKPTYIFTTSQLYLSSRSALCVTEGRASCRPCVTGMQSQLSNHRLVMGMWWPIAGESKAHIRQPWRGPFCNHVWYHRAATQPGRRRRFMRWRTSRMHNQTSPSRRHGSDPMNAMHGDNTSTQPIFVLLLVIPRFPQEKEIVVVDLV